MYALGAVPLNAMTLADGDTLAADHRWRPERGSWDQGRNVDGKRLNRCIVVSCGVALSGISTGVVAASRLQRTDSGRAIDQPTAPSMQQQTRQQTCVSHRSLVRLGGRDWPLRTALKGLVAIEAGRARAHEKVIDFLSILTKSRVQNSRINSATTNSWIPLRD